MHSRSQCAGESRCFGDLEIAAESRRAGLTLHEDVRARPYSEVSSWERGIVVSGGKKLSDSELIGDAGIALIHSKIAAMAAGWDTPQPSSAGKTAKIGK